MITINIIILIKNKKVNSKTTICFPFYLTSTTITAEVQSTSQNNSVACDTDSNIPTSSIKISPQIEDLISDESIQKGLVPYEINSESESDYESYPEKNKKDKNMFEL